MKHRYRPFPLLILITSGLVEIFLLAVSYMPRQLGLDTRPRTQAAYRSRVSTQRYNNVRAALALGPRRRHV